VLDDAGLRERMAEKNYRLACKYFSYHILRTKLYYILTAIFGEEGSYDGCGEPTT
jgi:hypothetical protein